MEGDRFARVVAWTETDKDTKLCEMDMVIDWRDKSVCSGKWLGLTLHDD